MIRKRRRNTRQGGQGGPLSRARDLCDKQPARQSYGARVFQTERMASAKALTLERLVLED